MKNIIVILTLGLLFYNKLDSQDKTTLTYKLNDKRSQMVYEFKSNDHFAFVSKQGLSKIEADVTPDKILDFDKGAVIFILDRGRAPWYSIEKLDSVYRGDTKVEKQSETKTINGYKCEKYTLTDDRSYGGTAYQAHYEYTFWVATDAKVNPKLSKYILPQMTLNMYNYDFSGLLVKIEYKMTMGKRSISEGDISLDKATTDQLKDSDVKWPWKDENIQPGLGVSETVNEGTNYRGTPGSKDYFNPNNANTPDTKFVIVASTWTTETSKDYQIRIKKLFKDITGLDIDKFKHIRLLSYM